MLLFSQGGDDDQGGGGDHNASNVAQAGTSEEKTKEKTKKKSSSKVDDSEKELLSKMGSCMNTLEEIVKDKKTPSQPASSSINYEWAAIPARKLDKLDEMDAEEVKYCIDGLVMEALREKMYRDKDKQ